MATETLWNNNRDRWRRRALNATLVAGGLLVAAAVGEVCNTVIASLTYSVEAAQTDAEEVLAQQGGDYGGLESIAKSSEVQTCGVLKPQLTQFVAHNVEKSLIINVCKGAFGSPEINTEMPGWTQ